MSNLGYALKVKFGSGSKLYEYFLPPNVQLPSNLDDVRAVVDVRGTPKIVKVIQVVDYENRMYDGDLKEVVALFDGALLYEKAEEPRPARQSMSRRNDRDDDEIPF